MYATDVSPKAAPCHPEQDSLTGETDGDPNHSDTKDHGGMHVREPPLSNLN
jgi:hypothetical protein